MMNAMFPSKLLAPALKAGPACAQLRRRLLAATLLAAAVPLVVAEVLFRWQTAPSDPWQAGLRLLLAAASAIAVATLLSWQTAGWVRKAVSIREMLDKLDGGDEPANAGPAAPEPGSRSELILEESRFQELMEAARLMSGAAADLGSNTGKLWQDYQSHVAQINDTSAAVEEIVELIQRVAENTFECSKVAAEARQNATVGSEAVANTMNGMQRIRNQVQSNARRIKQLGESAQQIGEIVKLISDVADRTSLLALNASIQAAMAGEAGQGFGVVAEEVELLSKRCNEATKEMARLVRGVQMETAEAVAGMEESIAEVVEGSKLASQAGDALADIDAVSNNLAELIDSITNAAKQQVRGGLLASRSMNEISAVVHDNAMGTKQAAQSAGQLAELAVDLRTAVGRLHNAGLETATSDAPQS